MKKLIIILFCLLIGIPLYAQKYKDIYPTLVQSSDDEALSILKAYMVDDLDHPNSNFRLALIYERRYKACNPITQYERALANANEAKLRFTKSAAVVNEKEVSKNTGYYADFANGFDGKGRPIVEYNSISKKIRAGYDSAKLFTDKMPEIYKYFTKSVNFHDKAIKLFNEINGNFTSRDRLLLMYNEELKSKLEALKLNYDSSIVNLDKYLATGKLYDPNRFDQSYTIKNIDTYRLQGLLTSPNFLVKDINIWNYKNWADKAIAEVNKDISALRKDLEQAETALNASLIRMNPLVYNPDFVHYNVDNKLIFNLIKYDNESLPVALLRYKQFKQSLISQLGLVNNRDTTGAINSYLIQLGDLIYKSKDADSLLQIAKRRIDKENISKYPVFFQTHYNSAVGLNQYISSETKMASEALDKGISEMFLNLTTSDKTLGTEYLNYRGIKIPTTAKYINPDSLDAALHTTHIVENTDGSHYLVGLNKSSRKPYHVNIFMAKADDKNKVTWYKELSFTEDKVDPIINQIGGIATTPEGCAILVRSRNSSGFINRLFYISENGEEIFNNEIETSQYPRKMQYVENTNAFILTYKGASKEQNIKEKQKVELMSINILGDVLWTNTLEYAGNFVDLINVDKGFMVIGNYSEIKDTSGKVYRTKVNTGQTNAFAAKFNATGKLTAVKVMESTSNYYVDSVVKVNDKIINLLGIKALFGEANGDKLHIIINSNPAIIHLGL